MPTLTREDLHKLVWTEPMRTVAERFGISDVGLKKHCIAAGIPVPERGYWAKLAAGKRVEAQALPPRDPGASEYVTFGGDRWSWNSDPEARLAEPVPDAPNFPEPLESVRKRAERRLGKVKSVRDLTSPHGGLRKLLEKDARRAQKFAASGWEWDRPLFTGAFERRRLAILNSLAIGLSKAGASLEVTGPTGREIRARVGQTDLSIALDHPSAQPTRHGEWHVRQGPVDDLRLVIGEANASDYRAVWTDDDEGKLEAKLNAITLEIVVASEALYRARSVAHHQWLLEDRVRLEAEVKRRRAEAERRERERRAAEEKARRDMLFGQAQAWRSAQDIRGFVSEVLATQPGGASGELQNWALWALEEADALDPVTSGSFKVPSGSISQEGD
ncbi:MAG: hypothetical protein ACK4TR_16035 [Phenylobacterium sp.]|uniref:hypothetical protein n=1 Tax=Phenylobacterium sp. TaxID=1871053 RepID=UPI00391D44F9